MPQNAFFLRTRNLLVSQKTMQRHFFSTLHPLSMVIFATATVLAFVLLHNSRFNFQLYTAWSNAYSEISLEVHCDLSQLLAQKLTKRIHSSKPALLNCPKRHHELKLTDYLYQQQQELTDLHSIRGWGQLSVLECQNHDQKVPGSIPQRSSGRILFSWVNFLCLFSFQYPFHSHVTAEAHKRS